MPTVNKVDTINLDSVLYLFNGDFFATKIFKELLDSVANNTIEDATCTVSDEVVYNYLLIRPQIESFVNNTIYERIYKSDTYDALISGLIDFFACLCTVIYMRRCISNVDIQPDEVITEYLKSFGFPCLSLFDSIQKREICRNVYGFLRKKGTPNLLRRLLLQLGFNYFCIAEYWLTTSNGFVTSNYILEPEIISQVSTSALSNDWELFLKDKTYTLDDVRKMDPLWIKEDSDIDNSINKDVMTLPAKSPYYQIGVAVSTTYSDKLLSSMLYAILKKQLYLYSINEDIKDTKYSPYTTSKVSILDLAYAWAMINADYSSIYDIFGLNATRNSNTYDTEGTLKKYDMDMVYDTIGKQSIIERYHDSDVNFDEDGTYYDTYITNHTIKTNVFGWNGDITIDSIGTILKNIKTKYDETYDMINYYPSRLLYDVSLSKIVADTDKTRLADTVAAETEWFIAPALFGDIDDTLTNFYDYNITFYTWLRNQLDTYEDGSTEKADLCIKLLTEILSSLENYIFAKCSIRLSLRQYMVTSSKFKEIATQLDKGFTPYHAKMIDPFFVYVIKDIPYDQILMSDINKDHNCGPLVKATNMARETFWRAEYHQIYDADVSEPYAPVYDWEQNTAYPNFTGYDTTKTITVNGKSYAPVYDFAADFLKINWEDSKLIAYSGYKIKLSPFVVTTNIKQIFTVEVNPQVTGFSLWSKKGTDMTSCSKIMNLIPKSEWRAGYNQVTVEEVSYHSKFDEASYNRTLPICNCVLDLNTFDDPKWNDRFDSIHLQHVDSIDAADGLINIGAMVVGDIYGEAK